MQKRNYYRAGWIKFRADADMPKVVNTLSEKKVCIRISCCCNCIDDVTCRSKASSCMSVTAFVHSSIEFAKLRRSLASLSES